MDSDFLHALNGDWDALLSAMRESRSLVHRTDASGMSILHWVCLHQDVPSDVVIKVVFANPHAVHVRNDAGHLPIDLALQAECSERILEILRVAGTTQDLQAATQQQPAVLHRNESYGHTSASNGYEPSSPQQHQQQHQTQRHQQQNQPSRHYDQQQNQPSRHYDQQHSDHLYQQHQHHQQQQLVMFGGLQQQQQHEHTNNYRRDPEDDDESDNDNESPYMVRAPGGSRPRRASAPKQSQHQQQSHTSGLISIYANEPGADRSRQRSISSHNNESSNGLSALVLTEQRLQQREHDLISYATEHDDVFDPSAADITTLMRPHTANTNNGRDNTIGHDNNNGSWRKDPLGASKNKAPRAQSSFPPRWKQSRNCHVCVTPFSLLRRRHHCRNCGQSVCGAHSTNRVALPKFALVDPQRLCDTCFLMGAFLPPPTTATSVASLGALPAGSGSFGVDSLGSSVPNSRHYPRDYRGHASYDQPQQPQRQAAYAGR